MTRRVNDSSILPFSLIQHPRPHIPRLRRRDEVAQRLCEESNAHQNIIMPLARIDVTIHRLRCRSPLPRLTQLSHTASALIGGASSAWSILSLPLLIMESN